MQQASLLQKVLDIRGGVAHLRQSPFYCKLAAMLVCSIVQEGNEMGCHAAELLQPEQSHEAQAQDQTQPGVAGCPHCHKTDACYQAALQHASSAVVTRRHWGQRRLPCLDVSK